MRTAVRIVFLIALLTALGGCAWIGQWLNPNHSPVAVISASTTSGEAPLEVTLDASASYDPDEDKITYRWDFGDAISAEGAAVQHGFSSQGNYTVQLVVTDGKSGSDIASTVISVSQASNEIGKQVMFDALDGVTYDSATGLTVSVPPAVASGTRKLVVTEDPTPQQPVGGAFSLESICNVSLPADTAPEECGMTPEGTLGNTKVVLAFAIPPGQDSNDFLILQWSDAGVGPCDSRGQCGSN